MVYSSKKDGNRASYFHINCDGVFPTVVIVKDTNRNKFGGYTTSSWAQSPVGNSCTRDQNAFTFSLSKKRKVSQTDKFTKYSIYRYNSYGPTFGNCYLFISDGCTGNQNSYANTRPEYDSNTNLIACYEVYHVIKQ